MPNVTVIIRDERWPDDKSLETFTQDCFGLCTGVLRAAPEKVHIDFVRSNSIGFGHPASIEIKYRTESFRPSAVMAEFVQRLDEAVKSSFDLNARIRCFGFGPAEIHALN